MSRCKPEARGAYVSEKFITSGDIDDELDDFENPECSIDSVNFDI